MKTQHDNITESAPYIADQLGAARAELKAAQDKVKAFERLAIQTGQTRIDGKLYRVAIILDAPVTRVDWRAIAEAFKPSRQRIAAHTKHTTRTTVRVSALNKGSDK